MLYAEQGDFPRKGALIEVGLAIAMCRPVAVVLPAETYIDGLPSWVYGDTLKPVGSWVRHPRVRVYPELRHAFSYFKMLEEMGKFARRDEASTVFYSLPAK